MVKEIAIWNRIVPYTLSGINIFIAKFDLSTCLYQIQPLKISNKTKVEKKSSNKS